MKNLLYLGNNLSETGKTQTTIETLSSALRQEGFSVFVSSNKKNKLLRLFDMLFAVMKHCKKADYVLIDTYSTQNFYYAYLSSQLCRVFHLKYIPILHGGHLPNRLKTSPRLSKALFKHAFINVAPSEYMASEFKAHGYSNCICIPNSIHLEHYTFKQRDFKTIKLLWVRSFSEIYNPMLAVKIVKALRDEHIPASLCMVGPDNDGSLQKTKNYAQTLGVDVHFTGKLTKPQWIALSENYTLFINTSNFDNMPVSVIEAMALGLPIISTNVGGLPYLIEHEKEGILVPANDENAFVEAIKKILANTETAHKMMQNARNKVTAYDWNVVKKLWISMLQN